MARITMTDYTFSDGTFVPKGTLVAAVAQAMHCDDALYADAQSFNPWRFVRLREADGESKGARHQMASTSPEYIAFGHGKHAW